jgi:hypothetical protein
MKVDGNQLTVACSNTGNGQMKTDDRNNYLHKDIPRRAKAAEVEESKEGYTGDALALRGDEGRDKLR